MRQISSPATFKDSYIAEVKEELAKEGIKGFKIRKSVSGRKPRKLKAPKHIKVILREAILELLKENRAPTYKEIKHKALEIYKAKKRQQESVVDKYFGLWKIEDKNLVDEIALDEEIYGRKILVDSNAFIYFLTGQSPLVKEFFSASLDGRLKLFITVRILDEVISKMCLFIFDKSRECPPNCVNLK